MAVTDNIEGVDEDNENFVKEIEQKDGKVDGSSKVVPTSTPAEESGCVPPFPAQFSTYFPPSRLKSVDISIIQEPTDIAPQEQGSISQDQESNARSKSKTYFRCDKCNYQTPIQYLLSRHVAKHSLDQPFECPTCKFSDFDHCTFVDHLVSHQNGKAIQCPYCSLVAPLGALKIHMIKHRATDRLDCSRCEFSSNYIKSMKKHNYSYHTKLFKCSHCQKCMTKCTLIKHCVLVHRVQFFDTKEDKAKRIERIRTCHIEDMTKENLEHNKMMHDVNEGDCYNHLTKGNQVTRAEADSRPVSNHSTNSTLNQPKNIVFSQEQDKSAQCSQPDDSNSSTAQVRINCSDCEYFSFRKNHMADHVRSLHTKKYRCVYCSSVMTKHRLIQHYKDEYGVTVHITNRVWAVSVVSITDECGINETVSSSVKSKPEFNFQEQKFKCLKCSFCTDFRSHVKSHMLGFHSIKFYCKYCSAMMTKHELIEHTQELHQIAIATFGEYRHVDSEDSADLPESATNRHPIGGLSESLKKHVLEPKFKEKKFKCSKCRFSTNILVNMKHHMARSHAYTYNQGKKKFAKIEHRSVDLSKCPHRILATVEDRQQLVACNSLQPGDQLSQVSGLSQQYIDHHDRRGVLGSKKFDQSSNSVDLGLGDTSHPIVNTSSCCEPIRSVENPVGKRFYCSKCSFSSNWKLHLSNHIERFHPEVLKLDDEMNTTNVPNEKTPAVLKNNDDDNKWASQNDQTSDNAQAETLECGSQSVTRQNVMGTHGKVEHANHSNSQGSWTEQPFKYAYSLPQSKNCDSVFYCSVCRFSSSCGLKLKSHFELFHLRNA